MTFGERVRARREQLDMTQDELAKKLGYKSRSSVNKIELDQRNMKQSQIVSLANALQTTPGYSTLPNHRK
jgi:transcriptional regulator with XRE-family HTH domain